MSIFNTKCLLICFLCLPVWRVAVAQSPGMAASFAEEFNDSTLRNFSYGSTGLGDAFKWKAGVESTAELGTKVLRFRIDPADSAGAGRGPEIISRAYTYYGSYSARIKIPDVRQVQPNTGAVVGYFTYNMDSLQGLSEIDMEWLVADPHILYIGTWTGFEGKLQRIGRTIDLSSGKIYNTISKIGYAGTPTALAGLQNQPAALPAIRDFDASARFYTYGFDWYPDRLRWWILDPATGEKIVLWDYTGSNLGIPTHKTKYRMNFWHTANWAVETNAKAVERPLHPYEMEVDWMKYSSWAGISQSLFVPAGDKHISYEGRIVRPKDAAELIWPGTSAKIDFVGTTISGQMKDQDTSNYYNVIVDGNVTGKIHPDTSRRNYLLAAHLPYGRHSVELFKRTEWDKGKTWFYGFVLEGKAVVGDPPVKPARKMEFFGNSITCGYAIEDRAGDSPLGYFENNYDSYAAITARHFNAQCHYTAKSGIGVMVSWFPLIMPELYNRLDPTDAASRWDFSTYVPDLVVINLLQNDAWITNMPTNEQFRQRFGTRRPSEEFIVQSYRNFVRKVRQVYPKAQIICMLGNMDITRAGSPWPGYVLKAVQELKDARIHTLIIPYKHTPGHPKTEEQKAMAEKLVAFIDATIKW